MCPRSFRLTTEDHRIVAAARLQALISSCLYRPLIAVESNREHDQSQGVAWSLEHDNSHHISTIAQR